MHAAARERAAGCGLGNLVAQRTSGLCRLDFCNDIPPVTVVDGFKPQPFLARLCGGRQV